MQPTRLMFVLLSTLQFDRLITNERTIYRCHFVDHGFRGARMSSYREELPQTFLLASSRFGACRYICKEKLTGCHGVTYLNDRDRADGLNDSI